MNLNPFIGIPYQDRGSSFGGCDCWGLIWLFFMEERRVLIPRYEGYESAEGKDIHEHIQRGWAGWQTVPEGAVLEPFDVLALRVGGLPVHCGIYIGGGRMLHTLRGRESCTEKVLSGYWSRHIVRVGRWN
jgi:cell wall-associated NlpC family hydrolase